LRLDLAPLVALLVAVTAAASPAQPPVPRPGPIPAGTATIRGRVVDDQSGEPIANVTMRLTLVRTQLSAGTETDANGEYAFAGIAGGEYNVHAFSTTHIRQCHGATDPIKIRCGAIVVVSDQRRSGIDFVLQRGAVVSGRVIDHEGRPVAGARVWPAGKVTSGATVTTERDGTFVLTNLAGDRLTVAVERASTPDVPTSPPVYYPGVLDPDGAQELDASAGSVTTGISIVLPRAVAHAMVVRVAAPPTAQDVSVTLMSVAPRVARRIDLNADGVGTVKGLQERRYWVKAQARSGDDTLAAFEIVDLIQDTHEVNLLLQPSGRITGKVVAERGGVPPLDGLRVAAAWMDDATEIDPLVPDQAEVSPDGLFSLEGLFGTRALQLIGLSPDWQVRSILLGRSDITSTGVDLLAGTTVQVTVVVGRR
jgi:hypothetical protein